MPKILIVEDEVELAGLVAGELRRDSYDTLVAHTAGEGLELWKQEQPDLVILDWVLPDMEGIEVCRKIRQKSVVPILMLTARGSEMERIWGLDVGADDYMIKPFSTGELRARVRAMLRRMVLMEQEKGKHEQTCIDYGFIRLNVETREVFLEDSLLELTPKEYELLHLFLAHPGRVLSRKFLLEQIWDLTYDGFDRTVDTHVSRLRRKLAPYSKHILTVWGMGYKFVLKTANNDSSQE